MNSCPGGGVVEFPHDVPGRFLQEQLQVLQVAIVDLHMGQLLVVGKMNHKFYKGDRLQFMDILLCHADHGRIDPDPEILLMGMQDHTGTMGIQPGFTKAREGEANIPGHTLDTTGKGIIGHGSRASQFLVCPDEGGLGAVAAIVPASHHGGDGKA
jgi:hypothetical protein